MSRNSGRRGSRRWGRWGVVAGLLAGMAAPANTAEPTTGVSGELAVDGAAIALTHGVASATTMGGEDPITFVRLTEKPVEPGPKGDMDATMGKGGAMFAIHLHASGRVFQVLGVHPKADPTFPVELPKESVIVRDLRAVDGRLEATVESAGELRADGHAWRFRFDLRLPIQAD